MAVDQGLFQPGQGGEPLAQPAPLGLVSGWRAGLLVIAVGLVATLLESLIGATLQRRWLWLSNELVNGLQTLLAAALAMLPVALGLLPSS